MSNYQILLQELNQIMYEDEKKGEVENKKEMERAIQRLKKINPKAAKEMEKTLASMPDTEKMHTTNMKSMQESFAQADRMLAAQQKMAKQMKEGTFDWKTHNMFEGISEETKQQLNTVYMAQGLPDVNDYDLNDPEQLKTYNIKARQIWEKQAEKNRAHLKTNSFDYEKRMLESMKSSREYNQNYSNNWKQTRKTLPGVNTPKMKLVFALQDLMEDMQTNYYDFSIAMMEISIGIRERAQKQQ